MPSPHRSGRTGSAPWAPLSRFGFGTGSGSGCSHAEPPWSAAATSGGNGERGAGLCGGGEVGRNRDPPPPPVGLSASLCAQPEPQVELLEAFSGHWRGITGYYLEATGEWGSGGVPAD